MTEETPIQKALRDILHSRAFEKLDSYSDQQLWKSMSQDEQELLAHLFAQAAEAELKQPKSDNPIATARKSFQTATTLAPTNSKIWHRRGCAFASYRDPILLEEACLCLEKAVVLDDTFFDSWYAWANILMYRGSLVEDSSLLVQAEDKFQKAKKLLEDPQFGYSPEAHSDFFWHYGLAYFTFGRLSGEPYDFHQSISYFHHAKILGLARRDFLHDFANSLVALSILTNNQEKLFEAIEMYLYSLDIDENHREDPQDIATRYCNLGCCYQYLFETHHEAAFFNQAQSAFSSALSADSASFNTLMAWGTLLLLASKLWQEVSYLEESVEKFSRAGEFIQESSNLYIRWAEALSHLGYNEDSLELIVQADEHAKRALQIAPHMPDSWFASALISYQLGRYFSEQKYFLQACEQAQQGLVLTQNHAHLWHILAVAKLAMGEINDDPRLFEEALFCFQRANTQALNRLGCFWNDWGIALLNAAEITQDIKLTEEAIEKFEKAIILQETANPDWLVHYSCALDLLGDLTDDEAAYERGIHILMHVVASDPGNNAARFQLASTLSHLGELTSDLAAYHRAIDELQKLIEEDPEDEYAWNDLGLAFMNVAALSSDPIDKSVKAALYELAQQQFTQGLRLGNLDVYYHLACLHALQDNQSASLEFLEKALACNALPAIDEILEDEWLESLKNSSQFQYFIRKLTIQQKDE